MKPRSDGQLGELYGVPVIVYDGTNAEAIVKAMHLEEGDAWVAIDDKKSLLISASQLEEMLVTPEFRHDGTIAFPKPPTGLTRKLLDEGGEA